MPLSQDALQGLLSSVTDVVYLECLTLEHTDFPDGTVRLVNDRENLIRNNEEFVAFPFSVRPPVQSNDEAPALEIVSDIVDQRVLRALRSIVGKRERASIIYEVVTATNPDSAEWGPVTFTLESISTDGVSKAKLRASFSMGLLEDAFPKLLFTPGNRGSE